MTTELEQKRNADGQTLVPTSDTNFRATLFFLVLPLVSN